MAGNWSARSSYAIMRKSGKWFLLQEGVYSIPMDAWVPDLIHFMAPKDDLAGTGQGVDAEASVDGNSKVPDFCGTTNAYSNETPLVNPYCLRFLFLPCAITPGLPVLRYKPACAVGQRRLLRPRGGQKRPLHTGQRVHERAGRGAADRGYAGDAGAEEPVHCGGLSVGNELHRDGRQVQPAGHTLQPRLPTARTEAAVFGVGPAGNR